jgi:hypothetical protein
MLLEAESIVVVDLPKVFPSPEIARLPAVSGSGFFQVQVNATQERLILSG